MCIPRQKKPAPLGSRCAKDNPASAREREVLVEDRVLMQNLIGLVTVEISIARKYETPSISQGDAVGKNCAGTHIDKVDFLAVRSTMFHFVGKMGSVWRNTMDANRCEPTVFARIDQNAFVII